MRIFSLQSACRACLAVAYSLLGAGLPDTGLAQPNLGAPQIEAPSAPTKVSTFRMNQTDGSASLLFIGTSHSNDPADPQMRDFARLIDEQRPDLVLIEGGRWPTAEPPEEAIRMHGELAYASNLARVRGIRVDESDPPFDAEIAHVVAAHGPELARLHYALRMVPQFVRSSRQPGEVGELLESWLRGRDMSAIPGSDAVRTLEALDQTCRRELQASADAQLCWWRWGQTRWEGTPLEAVRATSSAYRDAFTLDRVLDNFLAGRRVMVVAGAAHLDAFRTGFRAALAKRRAT